MRSTWRLAWQFILNGYRQARNMAGKGFDVHCQGCKAPAKSLGPDPRPVYFFQKLHFQAGIERII
jgi:hypothetical protein